jgi:polar amino acid transport system permease protein
MQVALDFSVVLAEWRILLKGVAWTTGLTGVAAVLGVMLGVMATWVRYAKVPGMQSLAVGYIEVIRNTPFIVQLFFIFFGLPALGVKLSPEWASVIAMVINLGAYSAEIVRAGVDATPKGHIEAAQSLALTQAHTFFYVVLPPAFRRVWPALVSQIIIVMLGSAVCGQIATEELSFSANLIQSRNFRAFESFIIATGLYLLLAISLRALLNQIGHRFLFGGRRG